MLGRGKKVVASVEIKEAGERDGGRTGDIGGTNGGGDVDSKRAKAARLAVNRQYMRNDARTR